MNTTLNSLTITRKTLSVIAIFALVFLSGQGIFVQTAHAASGIDSVSIDPDPGQNCVLAGTEFTVSGTATADAPPGNLRQYHVSIDWGDGTLVPITEQSPFGVDNEKGTVQRNYTDTHKFLTGGSFTITVMIYHTNDSGNDNQADDVATIDVCVISDPVIDLAITKTASDPTPDAGQNGLVYTINVINNGPDTATNVVVTDVLPPEVAFVSSDPAEDSSGSLTWSLGDLANGASASVEVTVDVNSGTEGSDITNTASVSSDESASFDSNLANNSVDEVVTVNTPTQPTTGTLVVIKDVVSGPASAGDFTLNVLDDQLVEVESDPGVADPGRVYTLEAGDYTVTENSYPQYISSFASCGISGDGAVTIVAGATTTCTVANRYDASQDIATLHVVKKLIQDNGGEDPVSAFAFYFDGDVGTTYSWNDTETLVVGDTTYSTTSVPISTGKEFKVLEKTTKAFEGRYNASYSNCSNIQLKKDEEATCVITNNDIAPTLTVKKIVNNDNETIDPPLSAEDFTMLVTGTDVSSSSFAGSDKGFEVRLDAGSYSVDEEDSFGYTKNIGSKCSSETAGTIDLGEKRTCIIYNSDEPNYPLEGYVWEDENENNIWDGMEIYFGEGQDGDYELPLEGWTVTATFGELEYSTITDGDGHYYFELPAGTWVISETLLNNEWKQTFPDEDNGTYIVTLPLITAAESQSFFAAVFDLIIPTAHAQYSVPARGYDFGNVYVGKPVTTTSSGGGGGTPSPRCLLFDAERDGVEVTLNWETKYGNRVVITSDGDEIFESLDSGVAEDGSYRFDSADSSEFELTIYRGTRSGSCTAEILATVGPTPQVLGEQTSVVPYGAPNAGAGGTSPLQIPNVQLITAALLRETARVGKNG